MNENRYNNIEHTECTKKWTSKNIRFPWQKGLCIPQIFCVRYKSHLLRIYNDICCIKLRATVSQLFGLDHLCHNPRFSTCKWGRCINFSKPVFVTLVQPYRSIFVTLLRFSAIEARLMSVIWVHWPIFNTRRS